MISKLEIKIDRVIKVYGDFEDVQIQIESVCDDHQLNNE